MTVFNKEGYEHGVGVFIIDDGKLLLTHRIKGVQSGYWEVVAGHIKEDETAEQTAIREAREEAGVDIKILRKIGVNINHEHHFESTILLASVEHTDAKNLEPRNHSELNWYDLKELPQPLGSTTKKGLQLLGSVI